MLNPSLFGRYPIHASTTRQDERGPCPFALPQLWRLPGTVHLLWELML